MKALLRSMNSFLSTGATCRITRFYSLDQRYSKEFANSERESSTFLSTTVSNIIVIRDNRKAGRAYLQISLYFCSIPSFQWLFSVR
jgi:hypothetical protein